MTADTFDSIINSSSYGELRSSLSAYDCQRCALGKTRNHLVVDRGNPEAKAVLIGEAPGAQEDKEGKPFVGRSGKLLHTLFLEKNLDTNLDFLVANIIKCRPPDNRTPTKEEAKLCTPYLTKQIQLIRPKWIILAGRTALSYFFPELMKEPMNSIEGKWLTHELYPKTKWMTLFHPAYILRNRTKTPRMLESMDKIAREIKGF